MNFKKSAGLCLSIALTPLVAGAMETPEARTLKLSEKLKPVSTVQWNAILGEKSRETYQVTKGDTLYGISARLFGDGNYWPKIWALNNQRILNPHLIQPGKMIAFLGGNGTELPGLAIESEAPSTSSSVNDLIPRPTKRGAEWKTLPRQRWESVRIGLPPEIDPDGFDRRNKLRFNDARGLILPATMSPDVLVPLGSIESAKKAAEYLAQGDTVFIKGDASLEVGRSYTVTDEPQEVKTSVRGRAGYSYANLGTVKIESRKNGVFVGFITESSHFFKRGAPIIPLLPTIKIPDPTPSPQRLQAQISVIPDTSTFATAQHKMVYVDAGTSDGIGVGMVFRAYQLKDLSNGNTISDDPTVELANFLVVHAEQDFSMTLVIDSNDPVEDGQAVELLTDVSDLIKNEKRREKLVQFEKPMPTAPDELDALDTGDQLTDQEKRDLKQLEGWQEDKQDTAESDTEFDENGDDFGSEEEPPTAEAPKEEFAEPPSDDFSEAPATEPEPSFEEPPETQSLNDEDLEFDNPEDASSSTLSDSDLGLE